MTDKATRPSAVFLQLWHRMVQRDPEVLTEEDFEVYADTWVKIRELEEWENARRKGHGRFSAKTIEELLDVRPVGPGDPSPTAQDDSAKDDGRREKRV